jgi:hypothetical protein
MYKDKEVNKNVKNIFLSMCDVKVSLTFTSLNLVLLWQLFYLFCSSIVIKTFLLTSLSLYIFTIWKCIVYYRLCRDGIYFDKILVSEYKLFMISNKANFVCLYNYGFWLSLCKIVRSSVIFLLPLLARLLRSIVYKYRILTSPAFQPFFFLPFSLFSCLNQWSTIFQNQTNE